MRPSPIDVPAAPATSPRPFFARASGRAFTARATNAATVIEIYDEIGFWGVTAKDFSAKLREATGDIVLRLNSPGGDVFDGIAIYNAAVAHPGKVRVEVVGLAASAASLIAMAGDEIAIAENAFFMIHRAWGGTVGNEADHAAAAEILRGVDRAMLATYAARTGQSAAAVRELMNAETWFAGEAAVDAGFADEMIPGADVRARFDLSVFAKAPAELAAPERGINSIRDLEAVLRDAGASRSQARALASRGFLADADDQRDAAAAADFCAHLNALLPL